MHAQSRPAAASRCGAGTPSLPSLSPAWRGVGSGWPSLSAKLWLRCVMTDSLLSTQWRRRRRRPGRAGNGEGESRARRGGRGRARVLPSFSLFGLRHPAVAMRRGRAAPAVMFPLLLLPVRAPTVHVHLVGPPRTSSISTYIPTPEDLNSKLQLPCH